MRRKLVLSVIAAAAVSAVAAVEVVARVRGPGGPARAELLERYREYVASGEHRRYDPHPYTLYAGRREPRDVFDGDVIARERTPGVLRIACLGGSTTEGRDSWPRLLRDLVEQRKGARPEVMNWGTAGWTSTESLVNYVLNVQDYAPDVVLVHHAVNDVRPRLYPDFRTDYSHFRKPWEDERYSWLERALIRCSDAYALRRMNTHATTVTARVTRTLPEGAASADFALDPGTAAPFERNLRTIATLVRSGGATCALVTMPYSPVPEHRIQVDREGVREHNEIARRLAAELDCLLIDVAAVYDAAGMELAAEFRDSVHMQPAGKLRRAELVYRALDARGLLDPPSR